jgi:SAM-dependent methyltransferase
MNSFFILSCARSGSTSLANILNEAVNGQCAIEPVPNLNYETRKAMEGLLGEEEKVTLVRQLIAPRVQKGLETHTIYGEKNITYAPFVKAIQQVIQPKFVFLHRDGRDVVTSLMNWHNQMFGSIYRECTQPGELTPLAKERAANLPVHLDTSDYSRPRPRVGDPLYESWGTLSREEMCAYYWTHMNRLYLSQIQNLPKSSFYEVSYTSVTPEIIESLYSFLGLEGFSYSPIENKINSKINSLRERVGEEARYPYWPGWDGGQRRRFNNIAKEIMVQLGYQKDDATLWKPKEYGKIWNDTQKDLDWYQWMFNHRALTHQELLSWINSDESIESIADIGCGFGVGYSEQLADRQYVGIDISEHNINWCKSHRQNLKHKYYVMDIMNCSSDEKYDLVFSSGTIDNCYDIDGYLKAMVKLSKKWIYVNCYRGWFQDLQEHQYQWNKEHGCFYNKVSPQRVKELLHNLGCKHIEIYPIKTEHGEIPYETVIRASVS